MDELIINLTTAAGHLTATHNGRTLAQTPLAAVSPTSTAEALFAALGGHVLYEILAQTNDPLLWLALPPEVDDLHQIPWERALLPDGQFLVGRISMARLVEDGRASAPNANLHEKTVQLTVLTADALVDHAGQPRSEERIEFDQELKAIRRALVESEQVHGRWLHPTAEALGAALHTGRPTLLHLGSHGRLSQINGRPTAILDLEDAQGGPAPLLASHLLSLTSGHNLRLVVLAVCHSSAGQANLAHALVREGLPAVVGMNGRWPDSLSDEFAAALYRALLAGRTLPHALRAARQTLLRHADALPLPVLYARRAGVGHLTGLTSGPATWTGRQENVHLPSQIIVPAPAAFLGREQEMHEVAVCLAQHPIVTITGTGAIGKTALAASVVARFGGQWPAGVVGVTFANARLSERQVLGELLRGITGAATPYTTAEEEQEALFHALRTWEGLVLVDNYESVQHTLALPPIPSTPTAAPPLGEEIPLVPLLDLLLDTYDSLGALETFTLRLREADPALRRLNLDDFAGGRADKARELVRYLHRQGQLPLLVRLLRPTADPTPHAHREAQAIHRLLGRLATMGTRLLLTTRQRPTGLAGEHIYPSREGSLPGLPQTAGARLFMRHCPTARARQHQPAYQQLAQAVGRVTAGHPLAIALLGGEFDRLPTQDPATFLADWPTQLAQAHNESAVQAHHVSLHIAFERSYAQLTAADQRRLRLLSGWEAPFVPHAAELWWAEEDPIPALQRLVDANLLELRRKGEAETWLEYQFQPAMRHMVQQQLTAAEHTAQATHLAPYAHWLAREGYDGHGERGDIHKAGNQPLNDMVRLSLPSLVAALPPVAGAERMWYSRNLGWLQQALGDVAGARETLTTAYTTADTTDPAAQAPRSSLAYAMAGVYVTQGDIGRALALYQESLALKEQIGDVQGKSATLSNMANIHMGRGEWAAAETLLQEALRLGQQINSPQSIAFDIVKLGQVAQARGQVALARQQYRDGLAIFQRLQMPRETAQVQEMLDDLGD